MYKLFYAPGSAAMAPHAVLEEIGAPHELVRVDTAVGAHKRPDYLKLNPHGRVPTLVDGDLVIYEAAAITLHLADGHPNSGLAPALGMPERARYYQYLVYLTNTVQEAFIQYYHAEYSAESEAARAEVKAMAERRLSGMWEKLDAALAKPGPYLLGEQFSAADLYLMMLARWSRNMAKPATSHPHMKRLIDRVRARPAVERMMRAEGLE
ncbi:MAG: glutathione S-transferase family protein [Proteobacteria bacterium]|nr:glutathione S-transferase family protein [Pseudomonadota bacterium]MBI3499555.1 glutathione S-transferase family protein [Pseudomonadota bacterium]